MSFFGSVFSAGAQPHLQQPAPPAPTGRILEAEKLPHPEGHTLNRQPNTGSLVCVWARSLCQSFWPTPNLDVAVITANSLFGMRHRENDN